MLRTLRALSITLAACWLFPAADSAAERGAEIRFDIPAQSLDGALNAVAETAGVQLSYPGALSEGIRSPALSGRYTVDQALGQLLEGTGLGYRFVDDRTLTLQRPNPLDALLAEVTKPRQYAGATEPPPKKPEAPLKQDVEEVTVLPPITVTGRAGSLTTRSIEEAREELARVPGGTTVIEGERIRENATYDVNDALSYTPGLYIGSGQGLATGENRISMRGSDINSRISPIKGIKVLRDGLPITFANGETTSEQINLWAIDHIEVYRGANALEYGSSNLGGAINLVSPTGYTADKVRTRFVYGSDDFVNPSIDGGAVLGNGWDIYGSFSYLDTNGFRPNSDVEKFFGYGNIGYRWNESNETRVHFDIQDHESPFPGVLTKAQLEEDPVKNTPPRDRFNTGFPIYRVDLHHTVKLKGRDSLDIGAYYQDEDFTFGSDAGNFPDLWQDVGLALRHEFHTKLWGYDNRLVWGGLFQWMWIDDLNFSAIGTQRGPLTLHEEDRFFNMEIFAQDYFSLAERFTVVLGAQWAYRNQETESFFPALAAGADNTADEDFFGFNPKAGFIWQATDAVQLFGNVSRSFEPVRLRDFQNFTQTPPLEDQTATTIEVGTRGQMKYLIWDLAFYHAWVEDELLIVPIPPDFVDVITGNAAHTLHTGVELGLETNVPLGWLNPQDQVRLRGTYTWNHFRFDDDPTFGDNRLPAIPQHIGKFELLYQHPTGFAVGPNVEVASSNFVDFANTLEADSYVLLGARASYDVNKHLRLFVDGRNLTNEFYAASVSVTADAGGQDDALFNPGLTRSVFGGVELRW